MYAHKDQDSTSALTPSLPSHQSRVAAFARDSRHCGQVARAVRGAPLLRLRWLVAHPTVDDATSRLRGREMSITAAIRQTTATQVRVRGSQIEVDRVQP
jgi:hypothetical protein